MLSRPTTQVGLGGTGGRLRASSSGLTSHAPGGSTRAVGDQAEAHITTTLEASGLEVKATRNSGALRMDGDMCIKLSEVSGDYIRAECKHRNTSGFTVSKDHWYDIKRKAIQHGGVPALVLSNKNDETLIVMDLKQFTNIIGQHGIQGHTP